MRMSIYREAGVIYLTRTKDRTLNADRIQRTIKPERKQAADTANSTLGISVATSSSERNGVGHPGYLYQRGQLGHRAHTQL
jgi:hypothetical protein